jgi:predicted RecA/RadA family phage recombinase
MAAVSIAAFTNPSHLKIASAATALEAFDDGPFRTTVDIMCASYAKGCTTTDGSNIGALSAVPITLARIAARLRKFADASTLRGPGGSALFLSDAASVLGDRKSLEALRAELRNSVLLLVAHVGAPAIRRFESAGVATSGALAAAFAPMVALLPALAQVMQPNQRDAAIGFFPLPSHLTPSSVRPFRNLWVHLVLSRITDEIPSQLSQQEVGWSPAWRAAVSAIAVHSPLLIARSAPSCYDRDVGVAAGGAPSSIRGSVALEAAVLEQRTALANSLAPDLKETVSGLHAGAVLFLRSLQVRVGATGPVEVTALLEPSIVQACEVRRAASGGVCKAPLAYLADSGVEHDGLGAVVEGICEQAFHAFVRRLVAEGRSASREAVLLDHALFFLAHCCHRYARVRSAAFSYIVQVRGRRCGSVYSVLASAHPPRMDVRMYLLQLRHLTSSPFFRLQLADHFPQLLWRHECISALLETVEALSRRAVQGSSPPSRAEFSQTEGAAGANTRDPFGESDALFVPGLPVRLELPGSSAQLADVLADVTELACQWLLRAIMSAPAETRIAFQRYVNRTVAAVAASSSSPGRFAGLATGLYAVSPTMPASGSPLVATPGMFSAARAALASAAVGSRGTGAGGGALSLPGALASLASSGTRVRWTTAPVAPAMPSGGRVGFASSSWAHHSLSQILAREAAAWTESGGYGPAGGGVGGPRDTMNDDTDSVGGAPSSARGGQRSKTVADFLSVSSTRASEVLSRNLLSSFVFCLTPVIVRLQFSIRLRHRPGSSLYRQATSLMHQV